MEKTKTKVNKPLYIILAIIIACGLWLYVRAADNRDQSITISAIPVTFVGEDVLNANNLMLTNPDGHTASLQIQGKWSTLSRISRGNITLQTDLSGIAGPGEYELAFNVIWPNGISGNSVSVLNRNPFYIPVSISQRVTRPVELHGVFEGSIAEGYVSEGFTFQPETIQLSGEAKDVARVAYAQVTLTRPEPLESSIQEAMTYVLIGQDGEPIESDKLTAEPDTVNVSYSVVMQKEVPLTVDFIAGGGITGADSPYVNYDISPKTITLSGDKTALDRYSTIDLGTVDLSMILDTVTMNFPIPLDEDVESVDGVREATVQVTVRGLIIEPRVATNIEIINVPEGYTASVKSQSVNAKLRGTREALDMITDQSIQVVVDLQNQVQPIGDTMVPAKINVRGTSSVGAVGDYSVILAFDKAPES